MGINFYAHVCISCYEVVVDSKLWVKAYPLLPIPNKIGDFLLEILTAEVTERGEERRGKSGEMRDYMIIKYRHFKTHPIKNIHFIIYV